MAIFGCDPCETGQLCPAKIFLDIKALSRESDRQSSNLGHQSSNFQTPKIRFLFQNEKVLIAKEMALRRTSVAGELRAYAPMGVFAMRGKRLNRPPRVRQAGATILLLLLGSGVAWGQVPDSQKDPQSPPGDLTQ